MKINTNNVASVSFNALQQITLPTLDKRIALYAAGLFVALFVAYRVGYYFYQNRNAPIDGDGKKVDLFGFWSEGTFKNGQLHGKGKCELAGPWIFNKGGTAEGTFENGDFVQGKIVDSYYEICEGEFCDEFGKKEGEFGKKEGYILHPPMHLFKDGDYEMRYIKMKEGKLQEAPYKSFFGEKVEKPLYEGKFADNWFFAGKVTYPDGTIEEGTHYCCHLYGKGKRTLPDGTVEKGIFYNGKLI